MNQTLRKARPEDFEEFGYQTRLACRDTTSAIQICALHLHAYDNELQPELARANSQMLANQHRGAALHSHLYDRPIPVSDAAMLTHALGCRILLTLTALASIACLVGNNTTFILLGYGLPVSLVGAIGITALPLVVGHLAYEKIVAGHRGLQIVVIAVMALLCFGALIKLGEARHDMVGRATATTATNSYVDEPAADTPNPEPKPKDASESSIHETFGQAMLWFMIAADIALGLLVGLLVRMHTDEDYAAWAKLKKLRELVTSRERRISELVATIEIAKKRCMAGILRAENTQTKRRPPYHQALTIFFLLVALFTARPTTAQNVEHYEGILIDTSGSISRGGTTNELFRKYLVSARKLLLTEPPNSRVWASSISTDSFGGTHEIVKGWTPDARGVFTDDLNRARHELASSFEKNSSRMAPMAQGTDIFGGLWHLKALFESSPKSDTPGVASKTIWIFSDMMNETKDFPMPALIEMGPEQMLERAKANGLLVPLNGYKVYIYGASPSGLTPQAWVSIKNFWTMYFSAVEAELDSYSAECSPQR
jgi:hypothetical protein